MSYLPAEQSPTDCRATSGNRAIVEFVLRKGLSLNALLILDFLESCRLMRFESLGEVCSRYKSHNRSI